jgi:alkyl sulfatase BDS1-like metallo-beta-lactamase superfamily hydrolase
MPMSDHIPRLRRAAMMTLLLAGTNARAQEAQPRPATAATQAYMQTVAANLPFADKEDFALASRGLIAEFPGKHILDNQGRLIRDLDTSAFFSRPAPPTVNPSLWRNAQLHARAGLFKVADRIYQIRGADLSNMSIIVGDKGYVIIDTMVSVETAKAALALVRKTLGDKPVTGLIYTHSHLDHFGGSAGVISSEDARARGVPILAPAGFMKETISENVIAGPAMARRIEYMSGAPLKVGAQGAVSIGLGPSFTRNPEAPGTISLVPPTREIQHTGEAVTIDGVRFEFQLTPGSEAPAEMNIYLPDFHALCAAENANSTQHNILTPRGALVRSAKDWANYLTETMQLYGKRTDVLFTSHFWPHWGQATIADFLSSQRDAYEYLHDQSVRMMNNGLTGPEIARQIKLPDALEKRWFNRPYYGTLSFNAQAVYQRYMGWYDGNPVSLNMIPPEESGRRYVAALGGADRVLDLGKAAFVAADYQWGAELLSKLVFAQPDNRPARLLLADTIEQLGYQAESAAWRNIYLSGALDLRADKAGSSRFERLAGTLSALPLADILDMMAVRLVPERALRSPMRFELSLDGGKEAQTIEIRNGVLIHYAKQPGDTGNDEVRTDRKTLIGLLAAGGNAPAGNPALAKFVGLFDTPQPGFGLVLPKP